ncbi:MAG: tetratricopeptide repeat protein [Gammaproteobacteria bacterium]|nr:tetratricopeptide repeat protein [Gammaproteobacteria bacterium]
MRYQFNGFVLDTHRFELSKGGSLLHVEPQVIELLVLLIENRDRMISKQEINEKTWKGRVVSDSALSSCIKMARQVLGDDGRKQAVIRTIHKKGFRFVAKVSAEELLAKESDMIELKTDDSLVAQNDTVKNHAQISKPSIAVLPFTNMSGDPEQEHFSDGITEDIITALSRISGLLVVARHSIMVYKGKAVDLKQVGKEQGVRYILEGSVRKSGNRIRVTAQLIDTATGHHLWAERYDRDLDDIFAVQDEITQNVVVELQVKLVTGERTRSLATGTKNVTAWELVTRAKFLVESHVRDNAMVARQLLNQALELDKNYSAAWTSLGWVYWEEAIWGWSADSNKSMQKAYDAVQKALDLDPNYPGSYSLLGNIHMQRGDQDQAIAMNEKATALAPSDSGALALLAMVLIQAGHVEEGIQKLQRAVKLCPFPPAWYLSELGAGYHLNGDNDIAISILEQAVEREPDSVLSHLWLVSALVEMDRLDDARSMTEATLEIAPNLSVAHFVKSIINSQEPERVQKNLLAAGFPE